MAKPAVAITMGDPLGIGPEIVIKSMAHIEVFEVCKPIIVGSRSILKKAAELQNLVETYEKVEESIVDVYTEEK